MDKLADIVHIYHYLSPWYIYSISFSLPLSSLMIPFLLLLSVPLRFLPLPSPTPRWQNETLQTPRSWIKLMDPIRGREGLQLLTNSSRGWKTVQTRNRNKSKRWNERDNRNSFFFFVDGKLYHKKNGWMENYQKQNKTERWISSALDCSQWCRNLGATNPLLPCSLAITFTKD